MTRAEAVIKDRTLSQAARSFFVSAYVQGKGFFAFPEASNREMERIISELTQAGVIEEELTMLPNVRRYNFSE